MWQEKHMKDHDVDFTLFSLWRAMEARDYTVMDVITAVWWKETTLMILGSIWRRKPLQNSRYETRVSFAS